VKQGQSSTPADIPEDIFNPYNSKCPLEYLQVQMNDLVSLLFITMISIDFKGYKFFLCLLFFVAIIIFGELTSVTSNERMTTDIIFAGATPIN